MKNKIIGFIFGVLLTGGLVYAAYAYQASEIGFSSSKSDATNVQEALNELYDKAQDSVRKVNLTIEDSTYDIGLRGKTYTYQSSNPSVATVSNEGIITRVSLGKTEISVLDEGEIVFKYIVNVAGAAIEIIKGNACYSNRNNGCGDGISNVNLLYETLTDGKTTKTSSQGALLMRNGSQLYFKVMAPIYISFSSDYYSDSGGSSGKIANFYKINEDETKTLYYALQQLNNTENYGRYYFEPGNYYLVPSGYYVQFEEWTIERVEE